MGRAKLYVVIHFKHVVLNVRRVFKITIFIMFNSTTVHCPRACAKQHVCGLYKCSTSATIYYFWITATHYDYEQTNKLTDTEYKAMPNFVRGRKCVKLIKIQRSCLYFYTSYTTFWITATIYYFWITATDYDYTNKLTN